MNFEESSPCIQKAQQYQKLEADQVQCGVCERRCKIAPGKHGYCGARYNVDGQLFVITYGDISSISANPIEKKPIFHFHPGTRALTIGSWGCNFACPWCQNWSISKRKADTEHCTYLAPEQFLEEIERTGCQGTSFSLNEPTTAFFEYAIEVMPEAHKAGFYNTFVTNGYMTSATLRQLAKNGLDAMNIDIKGCRRAVQKFCKIDIEKVWQSAQIARELGIWVEITTLVIPGVNDTTQCLTSIAKRIKEELGAEVPWHTSAYYPAYQAKQYGLTAHTPITTLEHAFNLGQKAGLYYVYLGNVLGHPSENSYCRSCKTLLIKRQGYEITISNLDEKGQCKQCGTFNHFIIT